MGLVLVLGLGLGLGLGVGVRARANLRREGGERERAAEHAGLRREVKLSTATGSGV